MKYLEVKKDIGKLKKGFKLFGFLDGWMAYTGMGANLEPNQICLSQKQVDNFPDLYEIKEGEIDRTAILIEQANNF